MTLKSLQDKFNKRIKKQKKRGEAIAIIPYNKETAWTSGNNIKSMHKRWQRVGHMQREVI